MEESTLGKKSIFATEPVGKLILKFAIPCVISLVVNALYNIVDQIFIGWGVGYLGNGATNIVFPITIIALALVLYEIGKLKHHAKLEAAHAADGVQVLQDTETGEEQSAENAPENNAEEK